MKQAGDKVLVTGAAGMLGRHVVAELAKRGYVIHGVDRQAPEGWDDRHRFTEAALQDWPGLRETIASVDCVVHIAAIANLESAPEPEVFANNVTSTSTLVYAAAEAGITRFVYASSQSALGFSRALRLIPPDYVPVDEDHPCHLTDGYGVSKLVGEQVCRLASYRFGLSTLCLRFPVIWDPANFAAHITKRANDPLQAAKSMWCYVDVRDAARAVVLGLAASLDGSTVVNIAAPWSFCQEDVRTLVERFYGAVEQRGPIDANSSVFSAHRAEELLGFRAAYRWTLAGIVRVLTDA